MSSQHAAGWHVEVLSQPQQTLLVRGRSWMLSAPSRRHQRTDAKPKSEPLGHFPGLPGSGKKKVISTARGYASAHCHPLLLLKSVCLSVSRAHMCMRAHAERHTEAYMHIHIW